MEDGERHAPLPSSIFHPPSSCSVFGQSQRKRRRRDRSATGGNFPCHAPLAARARADRRDYQQGEAGGMRLTPPVHTSRGRRFDSRISVSGVSVATSKTTKSAARVSSDRHPIALAALTVVMCQSDSTGNSGAISWSKRRSSTRFRSGELAQLSV